MLPSPQFRFFGSLLFHPKRSPPVEPNVSACCSVAATRVIPGLVSVPSSVE